MPGPLDELASRCRAVAAQATRITITLAAPEGITHPADLPDLIDELEQDYQHIIAEMRFLAGFGRSNTKSPVGDLPPSIKD